MYKITYLKVLNYSVIAHFFLLKVLKFWRIFKKNLLVIPMATNCQKYKFCKKNLFQNEDGPNLAVLITNVVQSLGPNL